jgi:hypothetical protein
LAYKPPFPRPTKEELLVALSKAVKKKEQEHPIAKLPPDIDPSSLARSKAERIAKGFYPKPKLFETASLFLYYSPAKRNKECEDESFPKRLPSISNRHIDGLWA